MTAQLKLAEIISARLCHDMAGPVGTLSASLEMVADGSADGEEALEIAHEAAKGMLSRLRFIRAAWAVDGAELDAQTILNYCTALPQARKIAFQADQLEGFLCAPMSRGVLNLAMLGIESLPRGGKLSLAGNKDDGVMMTISGAHAAWPSGFAALMVDADAAWEALHDSRTLQAPLTVLIAQQSGLKLRFLMAGQDSSTPPPMHLCKA